MKFKSFENKTTQMTYNKILLIFAKKMEKIRVRLESS